MPRLTATNILRNPATAELWTGSIKGDVQRKHLSISGRVLSEARDRSRRYGFVGLSEGAYGGP